MPTLLGPWNVQYPINFVANGDTVHEGFNKHIQEIARIYGLLNALDAGKADTSDLTALRDSLLAAIGALSGGPVPDIFMSDLINHINSDNPHPNLLLTNTKGKLPVARVDGLIPYLEADAGFANWIKSLVGSGSGGGSYLKQNGKKTMPVTISSKTMGNISGDDATWHVLLSGSVTISIPQAYANTSYDAKVTLTASNTNFLLSPVISKTSGSSFTVTMPEGGGLGYNADITANKITGPTTSSINVSWETEGTLAS